jgi:O-antigen ligase
MSVTFAAPRSTALAARGTVAGSERSVRRRLGTAWGLLLLNVMGYTALIVHVPSAVGKAITQGALTLAVLLLLSVNRRIIVRPNLFLCLVTLLPLEAVVTALDPQFLGTVYRTFRLAEFVFALWLLSPWWGRRDLLLARYQLTAYGVVIGSVVLGLFVAPGKAIQAGRLYGAIWVIPPTQVAHYAAVMTGLAAVLWACGRLQSRLTLVIVAVCGAVLILTHTRTALLALVAGLAIAGTSLFKTSVRVRRTFTVALIAGAVVAVGAAGFIATWLARGETTTGLSDLTGRTEVWGPLLALPRTHFQEIFGFGLSNSSFNGLAIDSNWLSSYQEQGLFGVTVCALILLALLVIALSRPAGPGRALALFLVTYCLVASITEDGFTDATPYLLDLAVAASLLITPVSAAAAELVPAGRGWR